MASSVLPSLGLSFIFLTSFSVLADEAAQAVGEAIGSGVGELVADWHRQQKQIQEFNRRYFDLKRRVDSCDGCPDEAALRMQFAQMKFQVDLDHALSYTVAPKALGMPRQMRDISTMYLNTFDRMGESIRKECASRHNSWSNCLTKHIGKPVFDPFVMQERQVQAILSCPVTYKKYVECRDNTPSDYTGDEIRSYWRERNIVQPNMQVSEYYKLMRSDLTDYLVDLYAYQADAIRLLVVYGESVLKQAVEDFRNTNGKYPKQFEALADRILQQEVNGSNNYSYHVPANLAVLSSIVDNNKELVWSRYQKGPPLNEFASMNEYNVSDYARSIFYWKRWDDRKPWLEALEKQSILVCHYPRKISYHWYESDPRDKAPITGLPDYVIQDAVSKCPATPGTLVISRQNKELENSLATHPVKQVSQPPVASASVKPVDASPAQQDTVTDRNKMDKELFALLTVENGYYRVEGKDPTGKPYKGTCRLNKTGKNRYRFLWSVGASYVGKAKVEGKTVTVDWGSDKPVIYDIQENGSLLGTWAGGKATENLYPNPTK